MPSLSVVIICFNEEKNIGRCLDSVKDVADEIIVVDSFSSDRTEIICREKGARFIQHVFEGHIEQKNWAITQASYPHILSLDADEALDTTLKAEILRVKQNWQYDGYSMNRLTNYCGQWIHHCGWYPDRKLRLWDSRKGQWAGVNPHDCYELKKGSSQGHLKGNILHYSFYTVEQHKKQIDYFTTLSAKAFYAKGKRTHWYNLILNPAAKFLKDYFLRLGFLDGYYGWLICWLSAGATYKKYKKLQALTS